MTDTTDPQSALAGDDREEFEAHKRMQAAAMAADTGLHQRALDMAVEADRSSYSYQWTWLGLPIIQMPPDIMASAGDPLGPIGRNSSSRRGWPEAGP